MSVDLGSLEMNTLCVQVSKNKPVNKKNVKRKLSIVCTHTLHS